MGCFAMEIAVINNVYGIAALVGLYGIAFSEIITNNACMVTHLIGTQSHGLVYALSRTCEGLGGLVFPPISVAIHTNLLSHSMFSFAASLMFFAFILMLIVLLTKRNIWTPFSERVDWKQKPESVDITPTVDLGVKWALCAHAPLSSYHKWSRKHQNRLKTTIYELKKLSHLLYWEDNYGLLWYKDFSSITHITK